MTNTLTYPEAEKILEKYTEDDFLLEHGHIVGEVMGYFAEKRDPDNVEYWRIVGLLHDVDYDKYPEEHCVKAEEILKDEGVEESMIHAITSHGYGITETQNKPEREMEKVLFAVDELTGIIGAARLMRPSKSYLDMKLKSVKKKFKDKKFAAGCDRDIIKKGAELLDMPIEDLLQETLDAMKAMEKAQSA